MDVHLHFCQQGAITSLVYARKLRIIADPRCWISILRAANAKKTNQDRKDCWHLLLLWPKEMKKALNSRKWIWKITELNYTEIYLFCFIYVSVFIYLIYISHFIYCIFFYLNLCLSLFIFAFIWLCITFIRVFIIFFFSV